MRAGGGGEGRGEQVARRGYGNERMRATLLIRVYLTAPLLPSC